MGDEALDEEYLDAITAENEVIAATDVMDTLGVRLRTADGSGERLRELFAAGSAIAHLAEQSDEPTKVGNAARDAAGDVAQVASIEKNRIIDTITDQLGDVEEQAIEDAGGYRVDHGIGLDRFLEDHLDEVVIQRSTDEVDEPVFRWCFDDGERVETTNGAHFDHYPFFKKLSAATDRRLVTELASEKAENHVDTPEEYAQKSLGPSDRPWSRTSDLWTQSISGLVQERFRQETVLGPRTEAWEHIRARIASGRAVRDQGDAVTQGMIYVPENLDEIWIPTAIVADAVERVETSRRSLQAELAERGIASDELSGHCISEPVSCNGSALRFWRLAATHDEVPQPEVILDEVDDPTERSADVNNDQPPNEPSKSTETFGRAPEDEDEVGGAGE